MSAPQTEYPFTLPVGLVDADGAHHRDGSMRLARARDEIEPLRDARVRENGAYLSVLKLARVLTNVGSIQPVTPAHVEQLYAADFAHLERLYAQINSASAAASPPSAPPRPPALAGVSETALDWMLDGAPTAELDSRAALPIGLVQDRERTIAREALARNGAPPRRGRIHEGLASHADVLPERETPSEQLMRLSSQPPATPMPADSAEFTASNDIAEGDLPGPAGGAVDMEDVYEEMIVRLRRELLVERERMGAPLGG
jgi:hypothetical protein